MHEWTCMWVYFKLAYNFISLQFGVCVYVLREYMIVCEWKEN